MVLSYKAACISRTGYVRDNNEDNFYFNQITLPEENLVFLCGHYEGIDKRVLDKIVTDEVSIGDFVLTGGELPAMMMIDAISRLIPGVLNNDISAETESFTDNLLEYPQYSRPAVWHGRQVPEILVSGNHEKVRQWRRKQSLRRTRARRPDMYEKLDLSGKQDRKLLMEIDAEDRVEAKDTEPVSSAE